MNRALIVIVALAGVVFGGQGSTAASGVERPNILLIFADDLGWKDVGYNGTDFYETPNIDRLAKEGMVFHQAYAGAGNCAPSRACLLSGAYTPRHEVYAVGSTDRGPKKYQRLIPIPNKSGLARECVTLADALKEAGYATAIFGKWHLGGPDGAAPRDQGFDVVFDPKAGTSKNHQINSDPKGVFSITRAAVDFMQKSQSEGRPFFAYVAHHAIHSELQARKKSLKRFEDKTKGTQHDDPIYAACTYDLDEGVGMLLTQLKKLGLEKNTLVIFTSDNGGTQQSSQEPLRGSKGGYYEGGIREPFIARWLGVIKPGTQSNVPIINLDLYPTFLAAAGAPAPKGKLLDGENLLPLLSGSGQLHRDAIFWHFPGYLDGPVIRGRASDKPLGFRTRPVSVIRQGDWKLHLFHEEWVLDGGRDKLSTNNAVELYNLADDPGEHHDLSQKEIAQRDKLLNALLKWLEQTGAKLPHEKNSAYSPPTAN